MTKILPQSIDGLRVAQAPEGEGPELADAALVDPDDHDDRDRLRLTHTEASVQAGVLDRRQRAAQGDRGGDECRGGAGEQPTVRQVARVRTVAAILI